MSNTIRILYIIGAGPRVGWGIAEKFRNEGYKVAVGSRAPDVPAAMGAGFIPIQVDAADPTSIASSFVTVREKLGIPNVVVFNGMLIALHPVKRVG
jgi:NAD(P)-dependent dehydrogenase (short-subunit alcohol dehydrogenase family)